MSEAAEVHTLVGLVGHNPVSVLVMSRFFRPRKVLLVATDRTLGRAHAAARLLDPEQEVQVFLAEDPSGIEPVTGGLAHLVDAVEGPAVFDVTGGTKIMAVGVGALIGPLAPRYAYLDGDGMVRDGRSGRVLSDGVQITPFEVAWLYAPDSEVTAAWRDEVGALPRTYAERHPVSRALFETAASGRAVHADERGRVKPPRSLPRSLPPGLRVRGGGLEADDPGYLGKHGWLEEWCLVEAARVCEGTSVHGALGLEVVSLDEFDVVLVRSSRVLVVEAKAKARGAKERPGADLHKRVAKTRRFFGSNARVIFVHPAWGRRIPPQLAETAQGLATLIGGDAEAYRRAVREALVLG